MSRLLVFINMVMGFILFYTLAEISHWALFETHSARIVAFILGVMLLGNAIYLAFGTEPRRVS